MLLLFLCILLILYCTAPLSPCKRRLINVLDNDDDEDRSFDCVNIVSLRDPT